MRAKILNASAGSGKTYTLAYNYIRDVIWQPMLYRHILAVTFTNKATEEMKSRILGEINTLAQNRPSNYLRDLMAELSLDEPTIRKRAKRVLSLILHDYSHFTILTIDKFFQRILHAFIKELGIELNYNLELESAPVLNRSVDALIEQITRDAALRDWLMDYASERVDENAKWDLRGDIIRLGAELFKEGNRSALKSSRSKQELEQMVGAATKREQLTRTEFTDTAKSAVRLIEQAGLSLNDFTYKLSSGATYLYKTASGEIVAPSKRARSCAESPDVWMSKKNLELHSPLTAKLQALMARLCDIYDQNIEEWNTTSLLRENYRTFALLSDLYEQVNGIWREENSMLLSETKNILAAFIDNNDAPFIYEKTGNRFDRYYIDEFQDTSNREWLNFLPLLKEAMAHPSQILEAGVEEVGPAVLLVGDIKQSIYRWRGGDWRILGINAKKDLGEVKVENLEYNFRSLSGIVNFNNEIIASVITLANQALSQKLTEAKLPGPLIDELTQMLPTAYNKHRQTARKKGKTEGYISIERFDSSPRLIQTICQILDRGYKPSDIMILVRSSNDGGKVAEALLEFKRLNDNPRYRFDIMTQDALTLNSSPLCSFLLALLRLSVDSEDLLSRAIYNRWHGRAVNSPLSTEELQLLTTLRLLPLEEALERIIIEYDLGSDPSNTAYLQAFHQQVINFTNGRIADIPLLLNWWDECCSNTSLTIEKSSDTIEITTIHKAKGLEKKVVIIPYCSWTLEPRSGMNMVWATAEGSMGDVGCIPVKYGNRMSSSQFAGSYYRELSYSYVDNINLLYVALTRAVEQLHIFIPQPRPPMSRANVGEHLWNSLRIDGQMVKLGEMEGCYESFDGGERCCFGSPSEPEPERECQRVARVVTLEEYPTIKPSPTLKLPMAKYIESEGDMEFSPCDFGILMHQIFERADSLEEIDREIKRVEQEALLSCEQIEELRGQIERALCPITRSWYNSDWDRVLRERDIILPSGRSDSQPLRQRPDRVMLKGERAVVVDYKFGRLSSRSHHKQLKLYMELLRQMGYSQVEGWIWYVRQGRVESVE